MLNQCIAYDSSIHNINNNNNNMYKYDIITYPKLGLLESYVFRLY